MAGPLKIREKIWSAIRLLFADNLNVTKENDNNNNQGYSKQNKMFYQQWIAK